MQHSTAQHSGVKTQNCCEVGVFLLYPLSALAWGFSLCINNLLRCEWLARTIINLFQRPLYSCPGLQYRHSKASRSVPSAFSHYYYLIFPLLFGSVRKNTTGNHFSLSLPSSSPKFIFSCCLSSFLLASVYPLLRALTHALTRSRAWKKLKCERE